MVDDVRRFAQVDVFGSRYGSGNPVAVVIDGDGLTDAAMLAFAQWTNLSETTFLVPPTRSDADYRVRIFTPAGELAFAGHPTLGSAHAWLEGGGVPAEPGFVVQECGIGLVRLRRTDSGLAFAAPPLIHSGDVDETTLAQATASLQLRGDIRRSAWVDNGPGWLAIELESAADVLALRPDFAVMGALRVGVIGRHPHEATADGDPALYEVRAFAPHLGVGEDPVTGSLNAGLASWLTGARLAPDHYVASQGTALGRAGRVHVDRDGDDIWIGGATRSVISGAVAL